MVANTYYALKPEDLRKFRQSDEFKDFCYSALGVNIPMPNLGTYSGKDSVADLFNLLKEVQTGLSSRGSDRALFKTALNDALWSTCSDADHEVKLMSNRFCLA